MGAEPRLSLLADRMSAVLLDYSLAVRPGETLLVRASSSAGLPLARALFRDALARGVRAFPYVHLDDEDVLAVGATDDLELLRESNPMLVDMYRHADCIVRIDADEAVAPLRDTPASKQRARFEAKDRLLYMQRDRLVAGDLRRCTTTFPTRTAAEAAGMRWEDYIEFFAGVCMADADDPAREWRAYGERQRRLVERLSGGDVLTLRGPEADLRMRIQGRRWANYAGRQNFPDGEVYTAPLEDAVDGWIRLSVPTVYEDVTVDGAELELEGGVVIRADAVTNADFLRSVLDREPGARTLGAFGFGTNPRLRRLTGSSLLDGKALGYAYLSLGHGHEEETGSRNVSSVHWWMTIDAREATATLDGVTVLRDGELVA